MYNHKGLYRISSRGKIKSVDRYVDGRKRKDEITVSKRLIKGKTIKQHIDHKGRPILNICKKGKSKSRSVCQLVLESFVGPKPHNKMCRHLDGNPKNNNIKNLKWGTHRQNTLDSIKHGSIPKGTNHYQSKLTEDIVKKIRELNKKGIGCRKLGKRFRMNPSTIYVIIKNKTWRHCL